jgi:hypothetical protein
LLADGQRALEEGAGGAGVADIVQQVRKLINS